MLWRAPRTMSCTTLYSPPCVTVHTVVNGWQYIDTFTWQWQANYVAFSSQANYTDSATAMCRRNLVPTFVGRGVSRGRRGRSRTVVNLSILHRSRYFYFQVAPHLSSQGLTTFQTHCYSENQAGPGNEPGTSGSSVHMTTMNARIIHKSNRKCFLAKYLLQHVLYSLPNWKGGCNDKMVL
jgi:hypothetical protein